MSEPNIDEQYQEFTDDAIVKESQAFGTVPKGPYTYSIEKYELRVGDNPEFPPLFGRPHAHLTGTITDKDGNKRGKQFIDVSWKVFRTNPTTSPRESVPDEDANPGWNLDGYSKLWANLYGTLVVKGEKLGHIDVLDLALLYPVTLHLSESFKTPEGWRSASNADKKKEYASEGYQAKNFAQGIGKVKE